jgi:hypothetical protein
MIKFTLTHADWHIGDLWNTGHDMNEVHLWCTNEFGPKDKAPNAWSRWTNNNNSLFRFRDESDWMWLC